MPSFRSYCKSHNHHAIMAFALIGSRENNLSNDDRWFGYEILHFVQNDKANIEYRTKNFEWRSKKEPRNVVAGLNVDLCRFGHGWFCRR